LGVIQRLLSSQGQGEKTVHVHSYNRSDGTYVREHYRSAPGSSPEYTDDSSSDISPFLMPDVPYVVIQPVTCFYIYDKNDVLIYRDTTPPYSLDPNVVDPVRDASRARGEQAFPRANQMHCGSLDGSIHGIKNKERQEIQDLIDKYGKSFITNQLLSHHNKELTVSVKGEISRSYKPNIDYITPLTIFLDLERANLTVETFKRELEILKQSKPATQTQAPIREAEYKTPPTSCIDNRGYLHINDSCQSDR